MKKGLGVAVALLILTAPFFVQIQEAYALTISPVRMEMSGKPGDTLNGELHLLNEESETRQLYSSVQNFEARGESGTPFFLDGFTDLASWIVVQEDVVIPSSERVTIPFEVHIPQNAEPGGHFAAIFWGSAPPQSKGGGQVAIGGRLGMLVLLSVEGQMKEAGGLLEFGISDAGKVVSGLPVRFYYRLSNDGNSRVNPKGEIVVKNIFGSAKAVMDANRRDGNVLPGSVRRFEQTWVTLDQEASLVTDEQLIAQEAEKGIGFFPTLKRQWDELAFGMYTAELRITYGKEAKEASDTFRFFVIPWQLLSVVLGGLIVLWLVLRTALRSYARSILRQAQAGTLPKTSKRK